ncbi:hypothetical protein TYRP_005952 [Tyrophagus putrescentiae]|nr:hypothetical protein TYRP_005952 [Tyrophagus putrescentiae]
MYMLRRDELISVHSPPVSLVLLKPRFRPEIKEPPISTMPLPAFTTASAPCLACMQTSKHAKCAVNRN